MKALLTLTATLLTLISASANAALDDAGAQAILKKSGCASCHGIDKKIVGPAYSAVAAKHKGAADAATVTMASVRAGSKGLYGPMAMPPNPEAKISDADLHELVDWILTK